VEAAHVDPGNDFDRVVESVGRDSFLRNHWGQGFLHLAGPPSRFSELLSWSELSAILGARGLNLDRVRMYVDGKALPREQFMVTGRIRPYLSAGSVLNRLGEGAMLIVDSIEEHAPQVRRLASAFEDALRSDTVVNLYAAWRSDKGFDLHWDRQDTFILQVCGSKRWQVFEPTRLHPLGDDLSKPLRPSRPPVWDGLLQQGEALYLPRGWWHVALPVDEPTLHLTVTVVPAAGPDFLAWLVERLKRHELVRANLPAAATRGDKSAYLSALRAIVTDEWHDDLLEEFLAHWESSIPPRQEFGLPGAPLLSQLPIDQASMVRLASDRRLAVIGRAADALQLRANGADWQCPLSYEAALMLLNPQGVGVAALMAALPGSADPRSFLTFLAGLQLGGVLQVVQDGGPVHC
jgi:ribosomal protein L16 Arg81 hydroxylase